MPDSKDASDSKKKKRSLSESRSGSRKGKKKRNRDEVSKRDQRKLHGYLLQIQQMEEKEKKKKTTTKSQTHQDSDSEEENGAEESEEESSDEQSSSEDEKEDSKRKHDSDSEEENTKNNAKKRTREDEQEKPSKIRKIRKEESKQDETGKIRRRKKISSNDQPKDKNILPTERPQIFEYLKQYIVDWPNPSAVASSPKKRILEKQSALPPIDTSESKTTDESTSPNVTPKRARRRVVDEEPDKEDTVMYDEEDSTEADAKKKRKNSDAQKKEETEPVKPASDIMGIKIPKKKPTSPNRTTDISPSATGKRQLATPSPVPPNVQSNLMNNSPVTSSPYSRGAPFNAPPPSLNSPTASPTFSPRSAQPMKAPPELPIPPNQSAKEVLLTWSRNNLLFNQIPTFDLQKETAEGYIVSVTLPHLSTSIQNKHFSPTRQAAEDQAAVRAMEHLWRLYNNKNQQRPAPQSYGGSPSMSPQQPRSPSMGLHTSPVTQPPFPYGMQPPQHHMQPPHPIVQHPQHPQPPTMARPIDSKFNVPQYQPNQTYQQYPARDPRLDRHYT